MGKLEDKLLKSIERNSRAVEKLQKSIADNRRQNINCLLGLNTDCPKCGAYIYERDNGCLACDFFDRLAAQDKIRG
jgi:acetyl-CoA carboxylase beta subunit